MNDINVERQRQVEHFKKYGSILHCPEGRSPCCTFAEEPVKKGTTCTRRPCILDDPADRIIQLRIKKNRRRQAEAMSKKKEEEKKAAPIRDQRNFIQSHTDRMMDEIHRLEEASQRAFRQNKPNLGHTLFNRAGMKRQELKAWQDKQEERLKRSERNDQQSNSPDHGRNDEDG